tara:strand:+ start:18848 stop:18991 length:144 start_codon:yes stop_codon:yes gene_type:complete
MKNAFKLFGATLLIASSLAACDFQDGPAEEFGEDIDDAAEELQESVE